MVALIQVLDVLQASLVPKTMAIVAMVAMATGGSGDEGSHLITSRLKTKKRNIFVPWAWRNLARR